MRNYDRENYKNILKEEEVEKLESFFPLQQTLFIEYIKKELRKNEYLSLLGKKNDIFIESVLNKIKDFDYIGSYNFDEDWLDYFFFDKYLVKIMSKNDLLIAIFVNDSNCPVV